MAATITVRALDNNWDPMRGDGLSNFLSDIDAVGQIIATSIKLLEGEWFENTSLGTPMFQNLIGHPTTTQAVALILSQRILSAPYVTSIQSLQVNYLPSGRALTFAAVVQTQFGSLTLSNSQ